MRRAALAWGALAASLAACSGGGSGADAESSAKDVWFRDTAAERGVDFVHDRGPQRYYFPEIMCGGAALFDADGDGDLDLFCVQGGDLEPGAEGFPGDRLYENTGDGRFRDVTQGSGLGSTSYGMGAATGDCDGDGDLDLYVTNVGRNQLFRNDGGLRFTEITDEAGVGDEGWGTSATFVDYDGDGDLDLFCVNYLTWSIEAESECSAGTGERDYCHPNNYNAPARDVLYRNEGGGRFVDVSASSGIGTAFGNGLGVAAADFDQDGRQDIYVANDGMANQLWCAGASGLLEDRALLKGCALNMQGAAEAGMGVSAVDADQDGDLDLFMTHLRDETNTFYLNKNGMFTDRTTRVGLATASVKFTGFGTGFHDFDCDGELDLYVGNGRVGKWRPSFSEDPYAEPDQVFRGTAGGRFEELSKRGGTEQEQYGTTRAVVFGDIDNDGDVDVVAVDSQAAIRVLENTARRGHWIQLRVLERGGRDALGARVCVEAGERRWWRPVQTGYSYCGASDPRVHVGLGATETLTGITVYWADGAEQRFGPVAVDREHTLLRE